MADYCENGALVVPQSVLGAQLGVLIDDSPAGSLDGALIKLFKNDITPTPQSVLADFTLAAFGGSTPQEAVWSGVFYQTGGYVATQALTSPWIFASGSGETIYGYIITNAAGSALLGSRRFAVPQNVGTVGDVIKANVEYYLPGPVGAVAPVV